MRFQEGKSTVRMVAPVAGALVAAVLLALLMIGFAQPSQALAADRDGLATAGASALSTQASGLASSDPATIDKTAVKNAKAMVKSAKATSGSTLSKLKKVYNYIATDKKWKGTFSFGSYLTFWSMAKGTDNAEYYVSAAGPKTMKGLYKKYAIDAYKMKKASCYHYASLFAVAAKQAIGNKGTVKIAVGSAMMVDDEGESYRNDHHSWVEVKVGKKTYVYDTQQGNYTSKRVGKKNAFGTYCGKTKESVKATYLNYKGAKYSVVTL